ncbi:MAG: hypothetical protein KJ634_13950 [Gammaproteobacteria bacterium]|nr:hypothetical protein [Gammaproteobacteria bacterium]MBU1416719.1 hypothetical protein [Gammaproteobacteria bacterium]
MVESRFLGTRSQTQAPARPASPLKVVGNSGSVESSRKSVADRRIRTVVIGSHGVVGANMARFLKLWAGKRLDVTLVEPDCDAHWSDSPAAEGSSDGFSEYFPYDPHCLQDRYGIRVIGASVASIDPYGRALVLADGSRLEYDRLEIASGARLIDQAVSVAA